MQYYCYGLMSIWCGPALIGIAVYGLLWRAIQSLAEEGAAFLAVPVPMCLALGLAGGLLTYYGVLTLHRLSTTEPHIAGLVSVSSFVVLVALSREALTVHGDYYAALGVSYDLSAAWFLSVFGGLVTASVFQFYFVVQFGIRWLARSGVA